MRRSQGMLASFGHRAVARYLIAVALAFASFAGASLASTPQASASSGNFCYDLYLSSGASCHSQYHTGYRIVNGRAYDTTTGGATCVGIDNEAGTTYVNVCGTRFQTAGWTGYVASGYAYVHNHDTFGTYFEGYLSADN